MRDIISNRIWRKTRRLSAQSRSEGLTWYRRANDVAVGLSERYPVSVEQASAILAVLSPGTSWERNIFDAEEICKYGEDAIVTTYNANKQKALRILYGGRIVDNVRGNKVKSFFENIANPETSRSVTLDRHMMRFMLRPNNDKELGKYFANTNNYSALCERVRRYADKYGMRPLELQAMLWLEIRPKTGGN